MDSDKNTRWRCACGEALNAASNGNIPKTLAKVGVGSTLVYVWQFAMTWAGSGFDRAIEMDQLLGASLALVNAVVYVALEAFCPVRPDEKS
ncbi:hypothetical protein MKZ38_007792 [Zalerion maritima]|uniref:Uncharacterized protein n=1 Tax=Zalerion maritima TaxID=339359 RepID=A0AAD5RHC0_9PEZI|nr:hypothetical protein MKZ38_007792 [Zalerion maritima]